MAIPRNIRDFMRLLEEQGELVRVHREVEARNFELSALIRHEEDGPNRAILFEKVKGFDIPVVANLYGSMKRCSLALGIGPTREEIERYRKDPHGGLGGMGGQSLDAFAMDAEERARTILSRQKVLAAEGQAAQGQHPMRMVDQAPCQEVQTTEIDLLAQIPVPWLCEKDAGPYITPAVLVQRDPDTGLLNAGIHRHQVTYERYGPRRMGVLLSEHSEGYRIHQKYEMMDKPCEVALCIAPEPVVQIMGSYYSPGLRLSPPYSEFHTAGALLGEPLETVKCKTVDLEVPTNTEMVVEGFIPPHQRIEEGPMAEYPDFYTRKGPLTFIEVTAITHRRNPIFHACMSGGSREHLTLGCFSSWGAEQSYLVSLGRFFPTVKDVAVFAGSRLADIVVSFRKRFEGEDKLLLHYMMATTMRRYITIVDDDIDPHDTEQVEWARATRAGANPDDFIVFPRTRTYNLDPEQDKDGLATRLGILATMPFGQRYVRSGPPREVLEKTKALYKEEVLGQ